jgi:MOSC domain-containing protein YiiM
MKILSVNVSGLRTVRWKGRDVETGIFKAPAGRPVRLSPGGVEGDRQADRRFHGGEFKAVYGYSAEDAARWSDRLGRALAPGAFGENLTLEGFDEGEVHVGDRFRAGTALLEAVQPRQPCSKLGLAFGDAGFVKRFLEAGRLGVYFRVVEEGLAADGDAFERTFADPAAFSLPALADLIFGRPRSPSDRAAALALPALPPDLREKLAAPAAG